MGSGSRDGGKRHGRATAIDTRNTVSGSSTFFVGGVTAYDLERKVQILGIDRAHAEPVDCVSPRVAAEMAKGAARLFDADIAVATTGYAEPPDGAGTLEAIRVLRHLECDGRLE